MKSLIYKDKVNRKKFFQNEKIFNLEKSIKKNNIVLNFQKFSLLLDKKFQIDSNETKLKNRCTLTGRSKSITRNYRLSRIIFRELGREGFIAGLKKSSW